MKKLLALTLAAALALSLVACGGNKQSNSSETELTMENYSTYLKISAFSLFTGEDWLRQIPSEPNSISCNSKAECQVDVAGASSNYDFVDTVITVKVSGTYDTLGSGDTEKKEDVAFSKEVTITCDIGGGGSGRIDVFEGIEKIHLIIENSLEYEMEVVSVSGTVARVG